MSGDITSDGGLTPTQAAQGDKSPHRVQPVVGHEAQELGEQVRGPHRQTEGSVKLTV